MPGLPDSPKAIKPLWNAPVVATSTPTQQVEKLNSRHKFKFCDHTIFPVITNVAFGWPNPSEPEKLFSEP